MESRSPQGSQAQASCQSASAVSHSTPASRAYEHRLDYIGRNVAVLVPYDLACIDIEQICGR